jgi:hypothetical protein
MVLMLHSGDDVGFFVLSRDYSEGMPVYSLRPWHANGIVDIEADDGGAIRTVPDILVNAVTRGVPIPRHGSMFGWRCGNPVTALVAVYAKYTPSCPEPCWTVMPLVGIPEAQWPPFTGECLLGHWFWEHYRAGSIVSLGGLIAETPDTVFWADTEAILGWDCCAVAHDVSSREGFTLRRGRYVYYQALRAGKPVPSLSVLLSDICKTDLAPRFQRSEGCDGRPQGGS